MVNKLSVVVLTLALLMGCSGNKSKVIERPKPFVVGDVVQPPIGCQELRERDEKADC